MAQNVISDSRIMDDYVKFADSVKKYCGCKELDDWVYDNAELIKNTPYGTTLDSGYAYKGAFLHIILHKLIVKAFNINLAFDERMRANRDEITKVCLVSQLSKCQMFKPNEDSWSINKRGIIYIFNDNLEGALRMGERSALLCSNLGMKFSPREYEAIRIIDRDLTADNYSKYFCSPLSLVIRQATEIVAMEGKLGVKLNNNDKTK